MSVKPPSTDNVAAPPGGSVAPEPGPAELDEATYLVIAEMLPRQDLERHMRALIVRAAAMRARLCAADLPAEAAAIAALAHALGGSGSMFGLQRLAEAARQFEHAVQTAPSEIAARAAQLAAAADAAVAILQELVEMIGESG